VVVVVTSSVLPIEDYVVDSVDVENSPFIVVVVAHIEVVEIEQVV
jgi:hypothetical protein